MNVTRFVPLVAAAALLMPSLQAGQEFSDAKKSVVETCPPDALFLFDLRSSYVFESDFERGNDASGDAWSNSLKFGHRIPINGPQLGDWDCAQWYLRLGAEYSRFDFKNTGGLPIPNTLQSASAVIALEYLVYGRTAVLFETQPGAYFEHDLNTGTFDAPTKMAAVFRLNDSLYFVAGATGAALRKYPMLPLVGIQWQISEQWILSAIPPEPKLIYKPVQNCEIWVGGEITGGGFKTDHHEIERKEKLSGAVVTYSDYRAGAGVTYTGDVWSMSFAGGYSFQRKFDYHRAEEGYETDEGAPYVKVEIGARF